MTTWYSVNGASWDTVRVGDRISMTHPGVPPRGMSQELSVTGNVTRLDESAVELNGVMIFPKDGFVVQLVIRQD